MAIGQLGAATTDQSGLGPAASSAPHARQEVSGERRQRLGVDAHHLGLALGLERREGPHLAEARVVHEVPDLHAELVDRLAQASRAVVRREIERARRGPSRPRPGAGSGPCARCDRGSARSGSGSRPGGRAASRTPRRAPTRRRSRAPRRLRTASSSIEYWAGARCRAVHPSEARLRARAQAVIGEHDGDHGFCHGDEARQEARVVAPASADGGALPSSSRSLARAAGCWSA